MSTDGFQKDFTEKVLKLFEEINSIPRCSGNEKAIGDWLIDLGKKQGWDTIQDEVMNVILKVPGKGEFADKEAIVLQGHLDMVCVKDEGSTHDFTNDPIEIFQEDGWLRTKDTTLGADNGIAIAISLAIALEKSISHPPLELLFTSDEERGLTGAKGLKPGILKAKYLINIDSEDEGVFTIGCAGGKNVYIEIPLVYEENSTKNDCYELSITRLSGGHSGIQIIENKPNAIKLAADIINNVATHTEIFNLCSIKAGVAHNAIPTNAVIGFSCPNESLVKVIVNQLIDDLEKDVRPYEPNMEVSFKKVISCEKFIATDISKKTLNMLMELPDGVFCMSKEMPDIVETSNNLAQIDISENKIEVLLSLRSSIASQIDLLSDMIKKIATDADAIFTIDEGYPTWQPDWTSQILEKSKISYNNIFVKEPIIEVIHAGLECGVIGAKYPGMQMISIGPTVKSPHTTREKLKIDDINKIIWFLLELFKNLG